MILVRQCFQIKALIDFVWWSWGPQHFSISKYNAINLFVEIDMKACFKWKYYSRIGWHWSNVTYGWIEEFGFPTLFFTKLTAIVLLAIVNILSNQWIFLNRAKKKTLLTSVSCFLFSVVIIIIFFASINVVVVAIAAAATTATATATMLLFFSFYSTFLFY